MQSPETLASDSGELDTRTRDWLAALPVTLYVTDAAWWLGEVFFVADSIVELAGRPGADFRSNPQLWLTAMADTDRCRVLERLQVALDRNETRLTLDYAVAAPDGTLCRVEDSVSIRRDGDGTVTALAGSLRRAAPDDLNDTFASGFVTQAADLLLELGEDLDCIDAGGDLEHSLGVPVSRLRGTSLFALMAPEDAPKTQRALDDHAGDGARALLELRLRHASGGYRWFEIHFSPRAGDRGGWYAIARDINERRRQTLHWDAYTATDDLTSALNRDAFLGLLRQVIAAGDPAARLTLIVFDIDHLATINADWGRAGGDLVLACIGEICQATLRERFSFGRLGDDDFALLLSGKALQETAAIAEGLRARLASTRVEFHGHWLGFSVSLGVAEHRDDESADDFLARAGQGLAQARRQGRDRVHQAP